MGSTNDKETQRKSLSARESRALSRLASENRIGAGSRLFGRNQCCGFVQELLLKSYSQAGEYVVTEDRGSRRSKQRNLS